MVKLASFLHPRRSRIATQNMYLTPGSVPPKVSRPPPFVPTELAAANCQPPTPRGGTGFPLGNLWIEISPTSTPPRVVGLPIVFLDSWASTCPPPHLKSGPVYLPWCGPHLMEILTRTRRLPGLFAFILVAPTPRLYFSEPEPHQ